jgi:aminomethyltransferase
MKNLLTGVNIRDPDLRTLLPEVERYFVRGGGLSVLEVLPA